MHSSEEVENREVSHQEPQNDDDIISDVPPAVFNPDGTPPQYPRDASPSNWRMFYSPFQPLSQGWVYARSSLTHCERAVVIICQACSEWSRRGSSYFVLCALMLAYTFLGAMAFMALEAPDETRLIDRAMQSRQAMLLDLLNASKNFNGTDADWLQIANHRLNECDLCNKFSFADAQPVAKWTFWNAVFFFGTIYTTIGYGHIAPHTPAGRILVMCYALIGIPLFYTVLFDFGKLFTRVLKLVWHQFVTMMTSRPCRLFRDVLALPLKLCSTCRTPTAPEEEEHPYLTVITVDDEFNLPAGVAVGLLLAYILAGAGLYCLWEEWDFLESFYFVFISMSTVGFGDVVPEHPIFMMSTVLYLVFGLALMVMSIATIQESLSALLRKAKFDSPILLRDLGPLTVLENQTDEPALRRISFIEQDRGSIGEPVE